MTPADISTSDDPEIVTNELKQSFMLSLGTATHNMLPGLVEDLLASEDPELKRKFMAFAVETLGWKKPPPKDANDNLPVFNFNFGTGGSMQVTAVSPDGTQQQIEFTPDRDVPAFMQSAAIVVNDDILFDD
jgi:hypothetical protein